MSILDVLAARGGRPVVRVEIPGWSEPLFIREMSGRERDAFEAYLRADGGALTMDDFRARYALAVLCEEDGRRLPPEALDRLAEVSASALDVIRVRAQQLNWLGEDGVEQAKGN